MDLLCKLNGPRLSFSLHKYDAGLCGLKLRGVLFFRCAISEGECVRHKWLKTYPATPAGINKIEKFIRRTSDEPMIDTYSRTTRPNPFQVVVNVKRTHAY